MQQKVVKRKSNKQTKKYNFNIISRKNVIFIAILSIIVCVIYFAYIVGKSVITELNSKKLDHITLVSPEKLQYTDIKEVENVLVKINKPDSFFEQDMTKLLSSIKEKLPWIRYARITKQWPNKLNIYLIEYEPIAVWNKKYLVSYDGSIFSLDSSKLDTHALPQLVGQDNEVKNILNKYLEFEAFFETYSRNLTKPLKILGLKQSETGSLELMLEPDILVKMGKEHIELNLDRFMQVYNSKQVIQNREIDYIDMRYDDGLVIKFKEPEENEATDIEK